MSKIFAAARWIFFRLLFYTLLIGAFTGFFIAGIWTASTLVPTLEISQEAFVVCLTVATLLAFVSHRIRTFIEQVTSAVSYSHFRNPHELTVRLAQLVGTTFELDALMAQALAIFRDHMSASSATLGVLSHGTVYRRLSSPPVPESQELTQAEITELSSKRSLLTSGSALEEKYKEILKKHEIAVFLPLIAKKDVIGFLVFGPKIAGSYTGDDLNILEVVGRELAMAVDNALSYEEIKTFNVTLRQEVDRATDDLKNANEKLALLDKLKDEFVSVASHELRTPMTAIKSYAWMALKGKGGKLEPKAQQYVEKVYASTDRLIGLVKDMLDVSRIEGGRVQLSRASMDMGKLVREVEDEFKARLSEAKLTLAVTIDNNIPTVFADREKIHQVLENLIGNAVKFTPAGGKITVAVTQKDGFVRTSVTDTGRGISDDDMPKLFKKFSRLENSLETITGEGAGLGLYICKQYVELHGGSVDAESKEGKGATFYFTLPITKPEK